MSAVGLFEPYCSLVRGFKRCGLHLTLWLFDRFGGHELKAEVAKIRGQMAQQEKEIRQMEEELRVRLEETKAKVEQFARDLDG